MQASDGLDALSEKEKQTLRLIVRGHDAKSIARRFDLSVHTINERLRDARRKLAVSSSREAARLLFEAEGEPTPHSLGDMTFGADPAAAPADQGVAPIDGAGPARRRPLLIGVLAMSLVLGLLALAAPFTFSPPEQTATTAPARSDVTVAAREFLELIDHSDWKASYDRFGASFRKLNTQRVWADTSEKVRAPLGAVTSRVLLSQEDVPAPPRGYEMVKFRTTFANNAVKIETVSLDKEDGKWRVAGVYIE